MSDRREKNGHGMNGLVDILKEYQERTKVGPLRLMDLCTLSCRESRSG